MTFCTADKRTITTELNPGCTVEACKEGINGSFANIAYIKAEGSVDVLHYIISSIGTMTVLVIRGKLNSHVVFDWEKLLSDNSTERTNSSIVLEPEGSQLDNSYGIVFTRMFEYNDTHDKASLTYYDGPNSNHETNWTVYDFNNIRWQKVSQMKGNVNSAIFNMTLSDSMETDMNDTIGRLLFKFNSYSTTGRGSMLPKMEHNMNNTLMEFLLDNFTATYPMSRFALEVVVIGTSKEKPAINMKEMLDDEYTPGVFKMIDWSTNPSVKQNGGYLEWKPICYTSSSRTRLSGTSVDYYSITDGMEQMEFLEQSVAYAYFGDKLFTPQFTNSATNISFGLTADGAYIKTNYTVWSGSIGYGVPPEDVISILVIGVISAGLGLPVIIIMFGGVYVIMKKQKEKKSRVMNDLTSSYSQINSS